MKEGLDRIVFRRLTQLLAVAGRADGDREQAGDREESLAVGREVTKGRTRVVGVMACQRC